MKQKVEFLHTMRIGQQVQVPEIKQQLMELLIKARVKERTEANRLKQTSAQKKIILSVINV